MLPSTMRWRPQGTSVPQRTGNVRRPGLRVIQQNKCLSSDSFDKFVPSEPFTLFKRPDHIEDEMLDFCIFPWSLRKV